MNYESGNVYIYLTFRTPIDVNTTTGLYDFSQVAEDSPFGGIYRIVQCENTFSDGNWKQKLKCIRMPGPQGPETLKPLTGNTAPVGDKADTPATKIGPKEPPKTSLVDASNGSTNRTTVANNGAASSSANTTDSLRNSSRRAAKETADKKATTTSNQAPIVVGFRYYRDLGQK